ncbi:MAG: hypothetical protein LBC39_01380 [Methanobrevibacter sp.]|jgi:predicted outer membrane repeat protein|nr:hypothetical protein [Candidatus Methanovirga aequatorialis]
MKKKMSLIIILIVFLSSTLCALPQNESKVKTIQELIDDAPNGTTINLKNLNLYKGDGSRDISITKNININGNDAIIDAEGYNRVFHVGEGVKVTICRLTIKNGKDLEEGGGILNKGVLSLNKCHLYNCSVTDPNGYYACGGCISNYGDLSLNDSEFIDNHAECDGDVYGGTIYSARKSNLTIIRSSFDHNVNDGEVNGNYRIGGAVYMADRTNLFVEYSNFSNNHADSQAGAIFQGGSSNVNIKSSSFINNSAGGSGFGYSGAITNEEGNLNIDNSNFTRNGLSEDGYSGGVITNAGGNAKLTVNNSLFNENYAPHSGGAIDVDGSAVVLNSKFINNRVTSGYSSGSNSGAICNNGKLEVIKCSFINNCAGEGGAIKTQPFRSNNEELKIMDSEFINNVATDYGGAICIAPPAFNTQSVYPKNVNVTNSKFEDNKANVGGGINIMNANNISINKCNMSMNQAHNGGAINSYYANLTLINSILSSNTATDKGGAIYHDHGILNIDNATNGNFRNNRPTDIFNVN